MTHDIPISNIILLCEGETWQGMPTNINSNINAVAHCGINTAGNVAKTLPLHGGESWQGIPMNINSNINSNINPIPGGDTRQGMLLTNVNSNLNTVAHSGINIAGNVEDSFSVGDDADLFSNANLRQEVSSNVNRIVKSNYVDFYITGPLHNEKTGRSIWSIVLGDSGKSWALEDTFVQSYLQTLLLKREKIEPSDINISLFQSFYEINVRKNEFGKESVQHRKPPKNGKPGQIVKHLSFVYGCPTSNVAKGMNAFVEAIKFLCFTMKLGEHNPVGSLLIEHLKEYHQGLFNHLTKDCDKVVTGNRLTNDMDSHFKGGFSSHYHERLNRFMVDYDIVCILKNHVG